MLITSLEKFALMGATWVFYVLVALIWLIPDHRIEKILTE